MKKVKIKLTIFVLLAISFCNAQSSLTIFHDSLAPRGNVNTTESINDIEYHDDYIYFSGTYGKIYRTSLTNPNSPKEIIANGPFARPMGISIFDNQLYFLESSDSVGTPFSGQLYRIDLNSPAFDLTLLHDSLSFPYEIEVIGDTAFVAETEIDTSHNLVTMFISMVTVSEFSSTKTIVYNGIDVQITDIEYFSGSIYFNENSIINFDKRIAKIDITNFGSVEDQYVYDNLDYSFQKGIIIDGVYYLSNTNSFFTPKSIYALNLSNGQATPIQKSLPPTYLGNPERINLQELAHNPTTGLFALGWLLYGDLNGPSSAIDQQNSLYELSIVDLSVQENVKMNEGIFVYPNPVNNLLHFSIDSEIDDILELKIISIDGKLIKHKNSLGQQLIDVSDLDKGNYIIEIVAKEGKVFRSQFIKS